MLRSELITPYRGVRYHLKEYSQRGPENLEELFNLRHASLRNVIERAFGVLKKRFTIISSGTEPQYPIKTLTEIVLACFILHNYLMGVDPDDELIRQVDRELMDREPEVEEFNNISNDGEDARKGAVLRDNIAQVMWHDYLMNRE